MNRRIRVYGPAYCDRVVRVDRPLRTPGTGKPLDRGADGVWIASASGGPSPSPDLQIQAADGGWIIEWPDGGEGPSGAVRLSEPLGLDGVGELRRLRGVDWLDDLGGMGAGYASALGGVLISALGDESDPASVLIARLLASAKIAHEPIRVPGRAADWTLLLSSGGGGDKLAIGFRGCHAALDSWGRAADVPCDLVMAASLTNRLAADALRRSPALVKAFAPARRNMTDRAPAVVDFVDAMDVLCCNREEWELLPESERDGIRGRAALISVTDGPSGSWAASGPHEAQVPAFPRSRPPIDTNRAGEAYASALLLHLLDWGWSPRNGPAPISLLREAMIRGSASASLTLDLERFGFPSPSDIDEALIHGVSHAETV